MARGGAGSHFVCQACSSASPRWEGQCRACGAWNTLVETLRVPGRRARPQGLAPGGDGPLEPVALRAVGSEPVPRRPVGQAEVDRVLGGGLVPGALLLLTGEPGVGKSTLVLQVAAGVASSGPGAAPDARVAPSPGPDRVSPDGTGPPRVLYTSGEESSAQLHLRADRLGITAGPGGRGIHVVEAVDVDAILEAAERMAPDLLVVDSIQTLTTAGLEGPAGSVGQVREAAARLGAFARRAGVAVLLVGHVTKDGSLAGPRTLEHLVDVVLVLEGDRTGPLRLLRTLKNRHGSTEEVGLLQMDTDGLREVSEPERAFLGPGVRQAAGLAVAAILEGSRPLLVEVEALVAPAGLGPPRRTATGIDTSRLLLLVAVLGRRGGVDLSGRDVYASLAGGISVDEPALDLPLALALASSHRDRPLRGGTVSCGEVSLLGELRAVRGLERRLLEAARLGFERAIVPAGRAAGSDGGPIARTLEGLAIIPVRTLREALDAALAPPRGTTGGEALGT